MTKPVAAGKVAKQPDLQTAAANETRACILMPSCVNSGLGVYSGGKYYEFDQNGNTLAKAALEKSKKDKGAKFKVTGKVTGGNWWGKTGFRKSSSQAETINKRGGIG